MGIKNLDKVLDVCGTKILLKNNKEIMDFFGGYYITGYNCHIDFSLLIHKFLMVFPNMRDTLQAILRFFKQLLKYNNKPIIYIDPKDNLRKRDLHVIRNIVKNKQIDIKKKEINNIQQNIILNDHVNHLVKEPKQNISYEQYKNLVEEFNNNTISEDTTNLSKEDHIKAKKDVFNLFINLHDFKYHHKYILDYILEKIPNLEIIYSVFLDAETNIICNIKDNDIEKNIIFTSDQDIILFSLHVLDNYFINIKKDFNLQTNSIILYKKNNLNLNISFLVLFFNESDYFKGIKSFKLTDSKIVNLKQKHPIIKLLKKKHDSKLSVIATLLQFYRKKTNLVLDQNTIEYIDTYLKEMETYLSISQEFYYTSDDMFKKQISYNELLEYINIKKPTYKTIINNTIQNVIWDF